MSKTEVNNQKERLVYFNTSLVEECCVNNTLNALSFFYKAKLLYGNSTIYKKNATLRLMAQKFGCSHNVVKKYLEQLNKMELVRYHNGNITFVSLKTTEKKLSRKNKIAIKIKSTIPLNQLKTILQFSVLKKNAQQQDFMLRMKSDILSEKSFVDVKAKRKYIDKKTGEKSYHNTNLVIGNKNLSKKLNTSIQNISVIKKKWQQLGLCVFYRQFKKVGNKLGGGNSWYNANRENTGVFMSNNGQLYKSLPSKFMLVGSMGSL